jgi:Methyltransferase domain
MTGCCCSGIDRVFGERTAARDLKRYRRKGPTRPTRVLLEAIRAQMPERASVLDIGGGVGAIQHELLAAGAAHATSVDASAAFLDAARREAERRGWADRLTQRRGDFVALADEVDDADVVTLDRVICCYPDVRALVDRSAGRAGRLLGLVYPRERLLTRAGLALANLAMRVGRKDFRAYVHRSSDVDAAARGRGLDLQLRRPVGLFWQVAVYTRARRA